MSVADTVWTVGRILQWTTGFFEHHGLDSPRLDAEILIAHALECQRVELYTRHSMPLSPEDRTSVRELVRRRARDREPVAYITGAKEFYGLKFQVNPAVLIPRPETESLVEAALDFLATRDGEEIRAMDVGTGSGAIAVAVAHSRPNTEWTATDISEEALEVARRNAVTHGVADRVNFLRADGLQFGDRLSLQNRRFDLLISNPPYIDPAVEGALAPEIRQHEPCGALFAEEKGDAFLFDLITNAPDILLGGGAIILEVGTPEQCVRCVEKMSLSGRFERISKVEDIAGVARGVRGVVGKTDLW